MNLTALRKQLADLRHKRRFQEWCDWRIRDAQQALWDAKKAVKAEWDAKEAELTTAIKGLEKSKTEPAPLPERAVDFLRRIQIGCTFNNPRLEPLIGPFYILHIAGGTFASGMDRPYAAATHQLVNLDLDDKGEGYDTYRRVGIGKEIEGRLKAAGRAAMLAEANRLMGNTP